MALNVELTVNGQQHALAIDPRQSVLDLLRDSLGVMSAKKGCDHGQCGACTVLSCLCLAVSHDGANIVTAEGLLSAGKLHPLQQAFVEHDALQCGYCTPGQVCSAVGMLDEFQRGHASHATHDVNAVPVLSDDEIRERMSGNLCRCGAYVNIVAAIRDVADVKSSPKATA